MTLNGHFAFKSGPCAASNGLAFWISEKTVRKFAEVRIQSAAKNVPQLGTVLVIIMELFTGVTEQKASNQGTVFTVLHSQFSHMLFTDICRK